MLKCLSAAIVTVLICSPCDGVINHKFFDKRGGSGSLKRGIDGGMECATCTVLISLIDQLAEVNNQTIILAFDNFCLKLPAKFSKPCQIVGELLGPLLIEMIAENANPDDICRGIGLCYTQKGQKSCALYKKTLKFDDKKIQHYQYKTKKHLLHNWNIKSSSDTWSICDIPIVGMLCVVYSDVFNKEVPFYDDDGDLHSPYETLRGASWRGKDCDDTRSDIYPGRRAELLYDVDFDSNCNGIWGFDNVTGRSYEEQFCKDSGQMGVVVLGDSVGAHFHAPEQWFDPTMLTMESLKNLDFILENELDWPQLSLVTGYMDSIWDVAKGPTDSIYKRLVARNRCNHRNYQNIAVNGDESFEIQNVSKSLRIDRETDYPLLIILELVGNDVCNHKPAEETIDYMTTEKQMHDNLLELFTRVNATVPVGSKVLIVGMADGDFLYQFLANRTHPFGRWRNDLLYSDVYEWWNCMQVTPCMGWLNNNATLRNLTTHRAEKLSQVMMDVAKKYQHYWSNLELNYMPCPITTVIRQYVFDHGKDSGYQLIEPVDGFHPNQLGQALSAAEVWRYMTLNLPHYLGPLNPQNNAIYKKFGGQHGY